MPNPLSPADRKIIILTPARNEAWILHRFLATASTFADHIIVADQHSTDGSRDIYPQYEKVEVIDNDAAWWNEGERQRQLIAHARERYGTGHILLALDADEVISADSMEKLAWSTMRAARPGTVLFFEYPTFYRTPHRVFRYHHRGTPVGFIDDGTPHGGTHIHGQRVPEPADARYLYLHDIKVMHYSLLRPQAHLAKLRMYSVLEKRMGSRTLFWRRWLYSKTSASYNTGDDLMATPRAWLDGYEAQGIDMTSIEDNKHPWYDDIVLDILREDGTRPYRYDNIWDVDWHAHHERVRVRDGGTHANGISLEPPSLITRVVGDVYFHTLNIGLKLKRRLN